MRRLLLLCVPFAALLTAQDPTAARVDRSSALRHYETVEAELRRAPPPADPAIAARRLEVIAHLRQYRLRGEFGTNPHRGGDRVPLFVDDAGRRCAVAWLLDSTGHGALTLDIHRDHNAAWVAELVGDGRLVQWLREHGLSAVEAVRIQYPGPDAVPQPPPESTPDRRPRPERVGPGNAATPSRPTGTGSRPSAPSSPPASRPGGTPIALPAGGPTTPRGVPITALGTSSWIDWWQWHRDTFERPQTSAPAANATTAAVSAEQRAAETLLVELTRAPEPQVRAAAVQALGRTGAAVDLARFLDDGAREVRLAALLGLGSSGNVANAYQLLSRIEGTLRGETLAVALAAAALLDGAAKRTFASEVARNVLSPDPSVRTAAALAAARQPDEQRHEVARTLLRAADRQARAAAAELLGDGAGAEEVATLTAMASDRDVAVRRAAALALGRSRHELALPALQTAFELEHEVDTQAIQLLAIGAHGGDAAAPFLTGIMANGSKTLRAHAALALALWGRGRDAKAAAAAIADAHRAERNRDQQGAYLLALGLLRHGPARDLFVERLQTSQNSSTRGAAAIALGLLGDRAALPALVDAAKSDSCPWARAQAVRAAAQLGVAAFDLLVATLRDDKDATVRGTAAIALGGLRDERAAEQLMRIAANESEPAAVRAAAATGLGRHFRRADARLPELRSHRDHRQLPPITAWAFAQEL